MRSYQRSLRKFSASSEIASSARAPAGRSRLLEFGTVKNQEAFEGLLRMSAYHHVKDGTSYPAVLVTTGFNDPRVIAWQPGKMATRLQAATASDKPVLLRVDFDAGHGVGSTKKQHELEIADEFSFLLWRMGVPEFEPNAPGEHQVRVR
jgi:prolyl oligopeptidase